MKPEDQIIAIAEACGWKNLGRKGFGSSNLVGVSPKEPCWPFTPIPDYLYDLNAMHEAEMWLLKKAECEPGLFSKYVKEIQEKYELTAIITSARERAEAFLKTIGKWEPAETLPHVRSRKEKMEEGC